MNSRVTKICITGGHLTPAKAVIDEIQDQYPLWNIVFIGRSTEFEGSNIPSKEKELMSSLGIPFVGITAGRLQRAFSMYTVTSLAKFPVGIVQSLLFCMREKPDMIVSFGGYVALPVVLAAWIFGIPVLTHEQTRVSGLANRIIGVFAKKICITYPDTNHLFPLEKTVVTGLPIRKELFDDRFTPEWKVNLKKYPLIYLTGGTTGSVSLNALLFPIIERLVQHYTVVHQTGAMSAIPAKRVYDLLPESGKSRYIARDYVGERYVGWLLRNASLVVGRSGANTVTELALFRKKALLIPLPWSGGGEQLQNAKWLEKAGLATVIEQSSVTPQHVPDMITRFLAKGQVNPIVIHVNSDGARRIVNEIQTMLQT